MIYVVATLQLNPGVRERVVREIQTVSAQVRREDGCLEYTANVDVDSGHARQIPLRPDTLTIIERWRDLDALLAHARAPHMSGFRQRVADLVVSTTLQVLAPADER